MGEEGSVFVPAYYYEIVANYLRCMRTSILKMFPRRNSSKILFDTNLWAKLTWFLWCYLKQIDVHDKIVIVILGIDRYILHCIMNISSNEKSRPHGIPIQSNLSNFHFHQYKWRYWLDSCRWFCQCANPWKLNRQFTSRSDPLIVTSSRMKSSCNCSQRKNRK